jgi:predicted TIM-barrel fold metal-dependent hydrolase
VSGLDAQDRYALARAQREAGMRSYDVHQHLWPEPLIRALEQRSEPPRLRGSVLELTEEGPSEVDLRAHLPERRLELLDRDGVDVAVISAAPTSELDQHQDLCDAYHDGILDLVADSKGRFRAVAAGRCLAGFVGTCVAAETIVAGCDALQQDLERAGQFLFVHPGPPRGLAPVHAPGWWAPGVDYTAQMQAAYASWLYRDAERFPGLRVLFAILGGGAPVQLERLRSRGFDVRSALRENVYFDSASYGRRGLELCLSTFGATQLVYGSDAPVIDSAATLDAVLGFGIGVADLVRGDNPARLLNELP